MRWRKNIIDGTFGDKSVILTTGVIDRPRKAALLFHGVHSSSGSDPGNKYAYIGTTLAENGVMPILTETSRKVRNRHDYADRPMHWIFDAFGGKSYMDELTDCCNAYKAVRAMYPLLPLTLWGFSLGGLSALLIAGGVATGTGNAEKLDGLILCGSGDSVFPQNKDIFKLPILSTVQDENDQLFAAARNLNLNWARVFRGSEDTTFPHDACVRIYEAMNARDKSFYEVPGSDHSFRLLHGAPSHVPLEEVYKRVPQLFAAE